MCCLLCCQSFRGAAYFGTAAHILLGIAIVSRYATKLFDFSELKFIEYTVATGTSAVIFTYGFLILFFGLFIYRGIENESLSTLKVTVGGFTFMQVLVLITHLILISVTFDDLKEDDRMTQVSLLALNLGLSFVHLATLFLYMIKLVRRQLHSISRSAETSESSLPLSTASGFFQTTGPKHRPKKSLRVGSGPSCSLGSRSEVNMNTGRYSTASSSFGGQRYMDGQWENLHV